MEAPALAVVPFKNKRLLNLCPLQGALFALDGLPVFRYVHMLYTKVSRKHKDKIATGADTQLPTHSQRVMLCGVAMQAVQM